MTRAFLPGFALGSSMYSRLEAAQSSQCIDIEPESTWEKTLRELSTTIKPGSLGVGYSLGGRIALGLALEYPSLFSGLVLVSTHAGLSDLADISERTSRIASDEKYAQHVVHERQAMFEKFDEQNIFDPLDVATQNFLNETRLVDNETIAQQLRVLGLGSMPGYEQRLIELRIPVLYISGARDAKYNQLSARYKKQTPFSHHRVLDADHRVPLIAPRTLSLNIEWFAQNVL